MKYKVTIRDSCEKEYSREFNLTLECYHFIRCEGDHVVDFEIVDIEENKIIHPFYYKERK